MSAKTTYFDPHSEKQKQALLSDKRITVIGTGTQWGKTLTGAIRMLRAIAEYTDPADSFIVAAPTYKILNQSTLVAFKTLAKGLGTFNEQKGTFNVANGGTVYFRTEHDPDSIVGITNVRHIWGDEAGKYRLYFWENMQARANLLGCPIDLTTSPYSLNWIYKDIIKPYHEGKRPDVCLVQAASWENPYHSLYDPAEKARVKSVMDERRFDMIFGGEWGQMVGRVYNCFDADVHVVDPFDLPTGTKYYAGVDWGYTQPFALIVRGITPQGLHVQVSETYKTGLTITDIKEIALQKRNLYGIEVFYCGPDQPGYIDEFNRSGLVATAANNDVRRGIDLHYELIKTDKFRIFKKTSPYCLDEYETYHWPEPTDAKPDQDVKDQNPVKQNDHGLDATRYCTIMTFDTHNLIRPATRAEPVPCHNRDMGLKRLLRPDISGSIEDF